jgi:hypothetical protein
MEEYMADAEQGIEVAGTLESLSSRSAGSPPTT